MKTQLKVILLIYKKDYRLSELCEMWYDFYGQNLKDEKNRKRTLERICTELKNPFFSKFTTQDFLNYRNNHKTAGNNTLNHYLAYLSAVFNELIRADVVNRNPLQKIKRLKFAKKELSYLESYEIKQLLAELKPKESDAYIIAKIYLATGMRWNEAVHIDAKFIINNQIAVQGKNGKVRYLHITQSLESEIKNKLPFKNPVKAFARTLNQLNLEKSKQQLTHLLRHTFASHFIMSGGNILALQKILDHSSLNVTMTYAHLSPKHLQEMTTLNPVNFYPKGL